MVASYLFLNWTRQHDSTRWFNSIHYLLVFISETKIYCSVNYIIFIIEAKRKQKIIIEEAKRKQKINFA
ncbi:hypothetical protein Palpr_1967 [Paludibacter propionicigenes WB4]|uniref:Uncharacterized protein n=1 Tax=Paludibacter propionicigenes (strain DSM 17365 / JCM 13257 / WB4) TaxID=694427 RepID=E4T5W0_PALPW|nr:hypothetical protein Palpr_1967 [Paludibacter propionicigenes WB4]